MNRERDPIGKWLDHSCELFLQNIYQWGHEWALSLWLGFKPQALYPYAFQNVAKRTSYKQFFQKGFLNSTTLCSNLYLGISHLKISSVL